MAPSSWLDELAQFTSSGVASGEGPASPFLRPPDHASPRAPPAPLECAEMALPPIEGAAMADTRGLTCPTASPRPSDTGSTYSRAPSPGAERLTPPHEGAPDKQGAHVSLLQALPNIIKWAANVCGLTVPEGTTQASFSLLAGRFTARSGGQTDTIWPSVPDISSLLSGAANEPLKMRAPVSSFVPVTKVQGQTDQAFSAMPPLEPSLSAVFGLRPTRHVGKRILPPTQSDQFATKLQDKIHKCSSQIGAAANNIALLALSIRREPKHDMAGAALDTITNLCSVLATCSARISAWTTLLQRQVWLKLSSSILEDVKKERLEGPISSDGLFGTHYQTVFERLRSSTEALEQVRKHAVPPRPDPRHARGPVCPREQARAYRSKQRCASPLATYAVMQPWPPRDIHPSRSRAPGPPEAGAATNHHGLANTTTCVEPSTENDGVLEVRATVIVFLLIKILL